MMSGKNMNRREYRVPLRMMVTFWLSTGGANSDEPYAFMADEISKSGFRIAVPSGKADRFPFRNDSIYDVNIVFGTQQMRAKIQLIWRNERYAGIYFNQRGKEWIVK